MATNTAKGTIVTHDRSHGTAWFGYNPIARGIAGSQSSEYNTYILQFKTPAFPGVSEKVEIRLGYAKGNSASLTLRYALCTSDENRNKYCNTYGAVTDDTDKYQVKSGTVSLTDIAATITHKTITIETEKLKSNTTYYLILWAYTSKSNPKWVVPQPLDATSPSVTVHYNAGIFRLDNGSKIEDYQAYIDNGSSWDLFLPEIDNGSDWDLYS